MSLDAFIKEYQPKNLEQCLDVFSEGIGEFPEIKGGMIDETEDGWTAKAHHGIGRLIRNEWGLWEGSELCKWFFERGIYHADDMSGIILTSVYRDTFDKDIELDNQIKYYKEYWGEDKLKKMKKNLKERIEDE